MADFITQPNDITALIAVHLTEQELTIFKMVCSKFNKIASHYDAFLQPLYNRLYQLDTSLPPVLNPDNAVEQFKHAFQKISARQKEEIHFLQEQHKDYDNYREELSQLDINNQTISQLEKQYRLLENINANIISDRIDLEKNNQSKTLNLDHAGITRFFIPEQHYDFLQEIQLLVLDNNLLNTINVKDFSALEGLYCHDNAPRISINLENCIALNHVHFLYEALVDLNITGASQYVQDILSIKETELLFKQLSEATPEQEKYLITRLGDRYNVQNCIQYNCASHIGRIVKDNAYSALNTVKNHYVPMFIDVLTPVNNKRTREEDEMAPEIKKHKPNNQS